MSIRRADAVIVGGGPAGSFVAIGLSRLGWDVLLIEARTDFTGKPCGEFLGPIGINVLARHRLAHCIEMAGVMVESVSLIAAGGAIRSILPQSGVGIRREDMDHALLHEAAARAEVRAGCRVSRLDRDRRDVWRVVLADGRLVESPLVIGADGRHSRIRQWTGLGTGMALTGRHALVTRAEVIGGHRGGEMHIGRLGQVGICPLRAASSCTNAEMNLNLLLSPAGAALLATMDPSEVMRAGIAAAPTIAERLHEATFTAGVRAVAHLRQAATRVVGEGVALVGDAALSCDPITGEGMSNALSDAEALVDALGDATPSSAAAALRLYERHHRRAHRRHRIEGRLLPIALDRPQVLRSLVAGFSGSAIGGFLVGRRHHLLRPLGYRPAPRLASSSSGSPRSLSP